MRLPSWIIPAAAAVLLLIIGSLTYQHFTNRPIDPAVRDSIAVIAATRRADSITHAQLVIKAETVYVTSKAQSDSSRVIAAHAEQARQSATHEAQLAREALTARDSATHWMQAYTDEHRRGDSLDAALLVERRASESARASALTFQRADSASQFRLARVEALNVTLAHELQRVTECHLLPFVPCPSRKVTAIATGIGTYLVVRQRLKS